MKRLHIFSFIAVMGLAFLLSACAPQPACLDLEVVRGTAVDALGVEGPACLRQDEVTLRFESATWLDLQQQARELTQDPELALTLNAVDFEPNNPNTNEQLLFLIDALGRPFGFDAATQRLRVIQPPTIALPELGPPLSDDALRVSAQAYAVSYAPVVLERPGPWAYVEDVKDPIHFFDWTSTVSLAPGQNPQRFQVALLSDGRLFSYMNYATADD